MSTRRSPVPSYVPHKQSGRARAVWTDTNGVRQDKLLPGLHNSPESLQAFARLQMELATSPTTATNRENLTIAELMIAYLEFAAGYYTDDDGKPSKEIHCMKSSMKPLRDLYASLPAAEFGPRALAAVREAMIRQGWCRQLVNRRVNRVRRVFKWGVAEELVPPSTLEALRALPGLRAGRSAAPEAKPVLPVAEETVKATLPHLPPHVRVMVELMWLTGMRPSEACAMTLDQINRDDSWIYSPKRHKTAHHGRDRAIHLGPRAQAVLTEFLSSRTIDPTKPIFSPKQSMAEWLAGRTANRKTPKFASHMKRNKAKQKAKRNRTPTDKYKPSVISRTVALAAKRAKVEHWHPYQLRHSFATAVRKAFGLEAAQVTLGHSQANTTQIYAERDQTLAARVAAEVG